MPDSFDKLPRIRLWFAVWVSLAGGLYLADTFAPGVLTLPSGLTAMQLGAVMAGVMAGAEAMSLLTRGVFALKQRPLVEAGMIRRIYIVVAVIALGAIVLYGLGSLGAAGAFFAMFGGMLLGWSLQAPVSGFAAWLLISLKRPFRPGDRVQFPNLGLTGDVKDIGAMYTVLDQVGGSVGSEEAVGRHILVPNAMLFSQVVINYTVVQEAAYMLDEVVARITYDSQWDEAERILINAATEVTKDIIEATGQQPYIRSDLYDYGVFMRLRYQTWARARAEIAYKINRKIFEDLQKTRCVDLAIPFVYSYRAGMDRKDDEARSRSQVEIREIAVSDIISSEEVKPDEVESLSKSIAANGLLQPIILVRKPDGKGFEVLAGAMRFAACEKLGWKSIPAIVKESRAGKLG